MNLITGAQPYCKRHKTMTISDLQKELIKHKWDAYIITRGNMFLSQEATLKEENKLYEICGFSGSAGTLIVFKDKAVLLVDGRYELQAAQEVDTEEVNVICTSDSIGSWLQKEDESGLNIAYDPWCHSISEVEFWNRAVKKHHFVEDNIGILGSRISSQVADIFEHDIEFAGVSVEEKISYMTDFINKNNLEAYFISECEAVSWLLNLRSNCLPYTPVLRAFALVDKEGEVSLFTNDLNKIEAELARYKSKEIGLSPNTTPKKIQNLMKNHKIWICNLANPILSWKAAKNEVEMEGFRRAHTRDGVAVCKFLYWLEHNWQGQNEFSIAEKLKEFRAQGENFKDLSFETIAAFGANGAVVHYMPKKETACALEANSVLLLDSGAQYLDGTTDITRTIAIGKVEDKIKDSFTQVLKAHIAAASSRFPSGTQGRAIDTLARAELWRFGKDFNHGTGHGVGYFGCVHESPVSLSRRSKSPLEKNQVTSIEPGYYVAGEYGIRIENLYYIAEDNNPDFAQPMLKFENLTLVPIDKRLINKYLLSKQEISWLNDYHKEVYKKLNQLLPSEMQNWLTVSCAPL